MQPCHWARKVAITISVLCLCIIEMFQLSYANNVIVQLFATRNFGVLYNLQHLQIFKLADMLLIVNIQSFACSCKVYYKCSVSISCPITMFGYNNYSWQYIINGNNRALYSILCGQSCTDRIK